MMNSESSSAVAPSDEELWSACMTVWSEQMTPLEISALEKATGMKGAEIAASLTRAATGGRFVQFRYPPLPCAAIVKMHQPSNLKPPARPPVRSP